MVIIVFGNIQHPLCTVINMVFQPHNSNHGHLCYSIIHYPHLFLFIAKFIFYFIIMAIIIFLNLISIEFITIIILIMYRIIIMIVMIITMLFSQVLNLAICFFYLIINLTIYFLKPK